MKPSELDQRHRVFHAGTLGRADVSGLVEAARSGGFDAISLFPDHVDRSLAGGSSLAELSRQVADAGLVVADLDPLLTWTPEAIPPQGAAKFGLASEERFFELAAAFGARSLNVAQGFGSRLDLDRAAEDLAGLCDRARDHDLIVTVEFLPWSGIPDAATAWDLIGRAGRDNAGVQVDSWHWYRGGADLDSLAALPGEAIRGVQLSDAPAESPGSWMAETLEARLLPGEGDAPLVELVRTLDRMGSRAPLGAEVFHRSHDDADPIELGARCARALQATIGEARGAT